MINKKENILVSACLLNVNCRYDGSGNPSQNIMNLISEYNFIPVCPEIFGGMQTPREPAEKKSGKVITRTGSDVTEYFNKGAKEVLKLAMLYNCRFAILKERSPSCGHGKIYDGTFSGKLIDGNGITVELLESNGVKCLGESEVDFFTKLNF